MTVLPMASIISSVLRSEPAARTVTSTRTSIIASSTERFKDSFHLDKERRQVCMIEFPRHTLLQATRHIFVTVWVSMGERNIIDFNIRMSGGELRYGPIGDWMVSKVSKHFSLLSGAGCCPRSCPTQFNPYLLSISAKKSRK